MRCSSCKHECIRINAEQRAYRVTISPLKFQTSTSRSRNVTNRCSEYLDCENSSEKHAARNNRAARMLLGGTKRIGNANSVFEVKVFGIRFNKQQLNRNE